VCWEQTWSTATGCRMPGTAWSLQSTTSKLLNLRTHNPGAAEPGLFLRPALSGSAAADSSSKKPPGPLHSHAGDVAYWPVTADGERRRCLPVPVALPERLGLSTASMAVHPFRTCEPRGSACVHVSPGDFAVATLRGGNSVLRYMSSLVRGTSRDKPQTYPQTHFIAASPGLPANSAAPCIQLGTTMPFARY
jgi:hypothetical protein